ncbi:MAG TPA: TonB-dependent receptor [Silvibacterium sp.]|nr:TonB-dependent receptor [Silvibacterium sp.]
MQWIKWGRLVLVAALAVFLSTISHAQAVYGTIFGSVTDNTGAAIPGATITITDTNKGTTVTATANEAGEFTVGHLIPDTYDVTVTNAGFKTFASKGLVVYADQSIKVEAKMEVGGSTQTVEVSANTVEQLKTDRADVSTTFTAKEVQDLPIGNRNFTNLQLLLPGAQQLGWTHAADENPQGSAQIQVDGQAFGGVAFQLDGTDNQDPILGIIVVNPNMDSLSETKITTQNFDAEFGKAVSSIVTAQTKSGTNSFHGSAFDYRESNANQARDPYTQNPPAGTNDTSGLIPGGLKNQFGGSIGGPILKDRLFFFGDAQFVRQKVGTSASMTVPSAYLVNTCLGAATSTGVPGCDFSQYLTALGPTIGTIYRPDGTPYPGNVIPAAELSQPALNLLKLLQPYAPNKTGSYNGLQNNYGASGTGIFNSDQWDERVDWQVIQSIHAFERFSRFTDVLSGTTIFGPAGGAGFGINNYGGVSQGANDSLATGFDWAVKPTVAMDFRVGYYRYNIGDNKYNEGVPFMSNLGIPGLNLNAITSGAGGFNVTDVGASGGPNNSQSTGAQYGQDLNITRCNCPLIEKESQLQFVNNWTFIRGNHSIKVGADLRFAHNLRVPSDTDRTGILSFGTGPTSNGTTGGLGFATLVLGQSTQFGRYVSTSTDAKEFQRRLYFYGQDTWRITPKLTANLGLRYEFYSPESVNGPMNGALMQMNDDTNTDGYLRVAEVGGISNNMNWSRATNAWNPRVGLAYQANPKMVIRAGYGRSFDLGVFGSIFGHVVTQNLPVLASQNIAATGGPRSYAFNLADGPVACDVSSGCEIAVPSNGLAPAPGYAVSPKARPNSLRLPTLDAWNASLQQSLTPTMSFTIAYVGNKGTHTLSAGDGNNTNPNEPGIFLPAQYSITGNPLHYVPTQLRVNPGAIADPDGGTDNTTYLQRYYGGSLTACRDGNYGYNNGTVTRPVTVPVGACGWTNGISYYGDDQDSHFNALQVTLAKQFSKGLSFTANYAWQQGIDFNSGYATWNKRAVRGLNNDIRRNQLIVYGVYELPFGRNQQFYSDAPGWVNQIIGGWQVSPVLNWSSGLPFTITYGECGLSSGPGPCYPNGKGSTLKTNLGSYDPITHRRFLYHGATTPLVQYANGGLVYTPFSGFSAAGVDQIGTAGRNNAFGPGFFNTDISLQKNFPIHESVVAQFRVDGFNAFNHINPGFGGGGATGTIDNGDQYVTGQAPGAAARLLQFSLRVNF